MTLDSIIEMLEKADCGDWQLDADIANLLTPRSQQELRIMDGELVNAKWGMFRLEAPTVTSSVDDAIALAEKVLPGFEEIRLQFSIPFGAYSNASVYRDTFSGKIGDFGVGAAKSPAIALCLAILKAKQMGVGE